MNSVAPQPPPPNRPLSAFLQTLMRPALEPLPDGELLARFAQERDEAAFAHLVRRHGAMVLAVATRVLGHRDDAEDAAQAAFVLLAQKAHRFGRTSHLGGWLHAVATRTAWKARARRARRRECEPRAARPEAVPPELPDELPMLVDRALQTLPAKQRDAVILCDLEGVPRQVAADRLGVPVGTLSSRLAAAHARLARRLSWPLPAVLAALAAGGAAEATLFTLAVSPTRLVSGAVATLVLEVSRAMLWTKIKAVVAVGFLAAAATGTGVAVNRYAAADDGAKPAAEGKAAPPRKPLDVAMAERRRAADEELAKLKGAWACESVLLDGVPLDGDRYKGARFTFDGAGKVRVTTVAPADAPPFLDSKGAKKGDETGLDGRCLVSPSQAPKRAMLLFDDTIPRGDWPAVCCVYELAGDALKVAGFWAWEQQPIDYPKGFAVADQPKDSPWLWVATFRRVKDAEPKTAAAERERLDAAELAKLKGEWALESKTVGGNATAATGAVVAFDGGEAARVTTSQASLSGRGDGRPLVFQFRCRVDSSQNPKRLTATLDRPGGEKMPSGKLVYELDGDTLKLAKLGALDEEADFPRGFDAKQQPKAKASVELMVATFRRVKPGEAKPAAVPDRVKELRQERVKALQSALDDIEGMRKVGAVPAGVGASWDSPCRPSELRRKLCQAELDLCETPAQRVAALEKLVAGAKVDETYLIARAKVGIINPTEGKLATAARAEAEIELELEKVRGK